MNEKPKTDFAAVVSRMRAAGLVKVAATKTPAKVKKEPKVVEKEAKPEIVRVACRWCGARQRQDPEANRGKCKRCGKKLHGALGVRVRDYVAISNHGKLKRKA